MGTVTIGGTNAGDFTVTSQPSGSVAVGGTTTFTVHFTPTAGGTRTATVSFAENDPTTTTPFTFAISGVATTTAHIGVTGNSQPISDGASTTSAINDTAFGSTPLGGASLSETYTITNSGTAPLAVGTVSIGGTNASDFTVTSQPSGSVAVGGNTTFTVQFTPTAGGTRTATISFAENDPTTTTPFTFAISGVATTIPTVSLANATQSINENGGTFSVTVNLSAASSVVTTVPFTLGGTAASGVNYSGVTASPIVIPAGQTSATITFTAIDDGKYGPNTTLTVTLGTPTNATLGATLSDTVTIVQLPPPVSYVDPLGPRQSALSFPITVTGSDPAPGPGVAFYSIYDSANGGPFTLWTTVPASNPTATFTAQSGTTYAFHSIATDLAGNVEVKSPTLIEASTYVPDLTPPATQITSAVANANGTFAIAYSASAPGGSGISSVTLSVQVDGGPLQTIGQFPGGTPVAGVYSGLASYQGLSDGSSHTYTFSIQGTNGNGIPNTAQAFPPITQTFAAPVTPQVTAFSVENGLSERSYIRYLDVTFNEPVSSLTLNTSTVTLEQFALNGVTPIASINLTGKISLVDKVMEIDFGAGGIGGSENLPNSLANWAALTADDGYYKLMINTGGLNTTETFYRLFGDVIGNAAGGPTTSGATVNGNLIGTLSEADISAIAAAVGQTATAQNPLLNADINGAGSVTSNDRLLAAKSLAAGRQLVAGLPLDD